MRGPSAPGAPPTSSGVLNGAVGDHLAQTGNGLSLALRLRHGPDWLTAEAPPPPRPPGTWPSSSTACPPPRRRGASGPPPPSRCAGRPLRPPAPGGSGGHALRPVQHGADGGRQRGRPGRRLERTPAAWPVPVQSVTLIGHSMGRPRLPGRQPGAGPPRWGPALGGLPRVAPPGRPLARLGEAATRTLLAVDLPGTRVVGKILEAAARASRTWARRPPCGPAPCATTWTTSSSPAPWAGIIPVVDDILGDMLVPVDSARGPRGPTPMPASPPAASAASPTTSSRPTGRSTGRCATGWRRAGPTGEPPPRPGRRRPARRPARGSPRSTTPEVPVQAPDPTAPRWDDRFVRETPATPSPTTTCGRSSAPPTPAWPPPPSPSPPSSPGRPRSPRWWACRMRRSSPRSGWRPSAATGCSRA